MDPNRTTDRILDEWDAVASTARPPSAAPRRRASLAGVASSLGLAAAGAFAAALVVGVIALGGRISPGVGSVGTPPPSSVGSAAVAAASASAASPTPTHPPTAEPASHAPSTPAPTATPVPTATPRPEATCGSSGLLAKITAWEGAAGSRIADVTVTNNGPTACLLPEPGALHLVDGAGRDLISGTGPGGPETSLVAGASVTTLVDASNYCGAAPAAPVRITFDLGAGRRVTAEPPRPGDVTVPPCNGSTVPASIQMQRWSR